MRYRFRGLIRASGKPVEGHVEAGSEQEALNALADNGIVTETLRPDPKSLEMAPAAHSPGGDFASAIETALDISSMQVPFDTLTERYKGKSVWVIDRDKIRRKVADVVDTAMRQSMKFAESEKETRARVAQAIEGLFKDNKNLTSPAHQVAAQGGGGAGSPALDQQIQRLANFINKAEGVLAAISAAARSGGGWGGGGGGPRRYASNKLAAGPSQNDVLMEIFKSNLALRGIPVNAITDVKVVEDSGGGAAPAGNASGDTMAGAPSPTGAGPEPVSAGAGAPSAPAASANPNGNGSAEH